MNDQPTPEEINAKTVSLASDESLKGQVKAMADGIKAHGGGPPKEASQRGLRVALILLVSLIGAAIAYFFHAVGGPLPPPGRDAVPRRPLGAVTDGSASHPHPTVDANAAAVIAFWKHESDISFNLGYDTGKMDMLREIFSNLDRGK